MRGSQKAPPGVGLLLSEAGLLPRAAGEAACAAAARACPMRSTCKRGCLVNAAHGLRRVNSDRTTPFSATHQHTLPYRS